MADWPIRSTTRRMETAQAMGKRLWAKRTFFFAAAICGFDREHLQELPLKKGILVAMFGAYYPVVVE